MDEMKIVSGFMRNLISKVMGKVIRRKLGCDMSIQLNEFHATMIDGKTAAHLDLDVTMEKEELLKLLKSVGY